MSPQADNRRQFASDNYAGICPEAFASMVEANQGVHVYAPAGPDLAEHLKRIEGFNTRADQPTHWEEKVYTGPDFLQRMLIEKAGNVVVLAGDNESGVAHGPGMGRIAAELIRGEAPFADPHSCRPERFDPADYPDEEAVGRELASRGIDRISDHPSG